MKTECGVLMMYSPKILLEVKNIISLLKKLQHRGQDSSGIGYYANNNILTLKSLGIVDNLEKEYLNSNSTDNSNIFLGHTRYATSSKTENKLNSAYPQIGKFQGFPFAFVFNGNIPQTHCDADLINREISNSREQTFKDALIKFMKKYDRAYNLIFIFKGDIYVLRDPYGTRPLSIAIYDNETIIVSSETIVFDEIPILYPKYKILFKTTIHPGTLNVISNGHINTENVVKFKNKAHCLFEFIYFMDKCSEVKGKSIGEYRYLFGKQIALQEQNNSIDIEKKNVIVCGIPNTAIEYGIGYAEEMGYKYLQVIQKNKTSQRTFIEENNATRIDASNKKYIYNGEEIKDKHVILVDDSIVRGITIKNIVKKIRDCNPKSIHIRVGCPAIINTCSFGVDIPTQSELVRNNHLDIESITQFLGVDSLLYLSLENINEVLKLNNFCSGCMNGNYNDNKLLEW